MRGECLALLGRVVHDEQAVDAGLGRIVHEAVLAVDLVVALHRVGVAHQHHGRGLVLLAELAHIGQHLHQAHAIGDGAVACLLDGGAVGHGVREGHAQLDHVGASLHHAVHQRRRDGREREACGDVGDQGLAAFFLEFGESRGDAAH